MPLLEWISSHASPVTNGQSIVLTLRGDFGAQTLGGATLSIRVPGSGFAVTSMDAIAFADPNVFEVADPASMLAPYLIGCGRDTGSAGIVDILRIGCTVAGTRGHTYHVTAELLDAASVDGLPLELGVGELSLTVEPGAVGILDMPIEEGYATVPYRRLLRAEGGQPPYTWSVASGSLPPGVTLDTSGVLSGTPTGPADEIVAFHVSDSPGGTATRSLRVRIFHAPLDISVTDLGHCAPGRAYEKYLTATGGKYPIRWHATGQAPGLAINASKLRGTPQLAPALFGTLSVTLTATDSEDPPQSVTRDVDLAYVPALPVQQTDVDTPQALVVARDLCLVDYTISAAAGAVETYRDPEFELQMDHMHDAIIGAMAELIIEILESDDPLARVRYRDDMAILVDLFREVEQHKNTGVDAAISLSVSVDDQTLKHFHFGGLLEARQLRAYAGRPLLPYKTPKSRRAREVRAMFQKGGRRTLAFARGVFEAHLEDFGKRLTGVKPMTKHAMYFPRTGEGLLTYGIGSILPDLLGAGYDVSRWFRDLLEGLRIQETSQTVPLTPGSHIVKVDWDGYLLRAGKLGPYGEMVGRSSAVNFQVTFDPANPNGWPRFTGSTLVSGGGPLSGSHAEHVSLASSGLDILVATASGLRLMIGTGDAGQPYAAPVPYPRPPAFTPEGISAGVLDPYGRTSVFLHSATSAALVVNQGPAGLKLAPVPVGLHADEAVLDIDRGGAGADGWRSVHLMLGGRRGRVHRNDVRRTIEDRPLPAPSYFAVSSSVLNDSGSTIALLDSGDGDYASMVVGLDAAGSVRSLEDEVLMHEGGSFAQPVDMLVGEFSGMREFAVAMRQGREVRLWRWQGGTWVHLPPVALPLRAWELCSAPGDAGGLAIGSRRFGSVLLAVWSDPDATPKLLHLHRGSDGTRIGGLDGTLAVSDPVANLITVFR